MVLNFLYYSTNVGSEQIIVYEQNMNKKIEDTRLIFSFKKVIFSCEKELPKHRGTWRVQ